MTDQASKLAFLPLKPDLNLDDGEAKQALDSAFSTIAQQPGFKSLYWGRQIEHPDILQLVITWTSVSAHTDFIAHPNYQPFLSTLQTHILSSAPSFSHAHLPLDVDAPTNPLAAPVTECINAFFPADHSEEEYNANYATFQAEAAKVPDIQTTGMIGGWGVEPATHEGLGEGVEGKMFASFIGWPTVEAHMEFRTTEAFGKIIGLLRGGAKGIRVWHVAFKRFT